MEIYKDKKGKNNKNSYQYTKFLIKRINAKLDLLIESIKKSQNDFVVLEKRVMILEN